MEHRTPPAGPFDASTAANPEPGLDVAAYWGVVRQHIWGITGLAFAVGLLATLFAHSLEPVFEAETSILIDTKRKGFSPIQEEAGASWMSFYDSQTYLQTQLLLLKSRVLAERVVKRLELWSHPEYDPRQAPPRRARLQLRLADWLPMLGEGQQPAARQPSEQQAIESAVSAVMGGVSARALKDSEIVVVGFRGHDPELAARIANAYADAYGEMGLETRLQTVQEAGSWLTERLEGLRAQLDDSERKLQEYREAHGIVEMSGAIDLTDKELDQLSGRFVEARAKRNELENLANQMTQLRTLSAAELASHSVVLNNPVIQSLKNTEVESERRVSEVSKRYGPKHPKMIAAQSDLRTVRSKLNGEISNLVAGVSKELEIARGEEAQLEAELAELKIDAQAVNREEFELRALERDVEGNRQLYGLFLARFKETNLGVDVESTNARVIDRAQVPAGPVAPRTTRIVAIAVVLALFAGVGLAFLVEHLDNTFKSGEEVEDALGLSLLGTLPLLRARRGTKLVPERILVDSPRSDFAEAIRTIRTGVVLSGLDDPHRVLLVTSTVPSEGKSTIAINLAIALGQLEKVLLIDADLRRASIGRTFGIAADAPGLSDLVAGMGADDECLHRIDDAGVDLLPSGAIPPNPLELLSSSRFANTLERLGERYDRIILDSAPAQAVSDPLILSRLCNAAIYVVKADATPVPLAQIGVKRLRQVEAPLIGVVLNQQDTERAAKYGYYAKYRRYGAAYDGYSEYHGGGSTG